MNNELLKIVDLESDLVVIISNNGKYSKQCLMVGIKIELFFGYD